MITKAVVAVCAALAVFAGVLWLQNASLTASNDALKLDNASLERSVTALTDAAAQSRAAAEVAKANADRERAVSLEYEAFRDNLRNGGNDSELPCWFVDYLNLVLGRVPEPGCAD